MSMLVCFLGLSGLMRSYQGHLYLFCGASVPSGTRESSKGIEIHLHPFVCRLRHHTVCSLFGVVDIDCTRSSARSSWSRWPSQKEHSLKQTVFSTLSANSSRPLTVSSLLPWLPHLACTSSR